MAISPFGLSPTAPIQVPKKPVQQPQQASLDSLAAQYGGQPSQPAGDINALAAQYGGQQVQTQQEEEKPKRGFWQSLIGPELNAFASGVRGIQAIPSAIKATYQAVRGQDYSETLNKGKEILARPIGNVKTYEGMSNKELLGSATQAAGQALMVNGGGAFTSFGLQGAGDAAQNNESLGGIIKTGVVAGVTGKVLDKFGPSVASFGYNKLVPQAAKNVIEPAVSKVYQTAGKNLGKLGNTINPYIEKAVPNVLSDQLLTTTAKQTLAKPFIPTAQKQLKQTYTELFTGTKPGKKALVKSTQAGKDTPEFLSSKGKIVDIQNGKINSQPLIENLKTDVQPLQQTQRQLLQAKDRVLPQADYVALDDIAKSAKQRLATREAMGSGELIDRHAEVDKVITNLKKIYGDNINLSTLDEIKSAQWQASATFDMSKPKFVPDVHYSIAKSAQKTIEGKVPEASIHSLNAEIGNYWEAVKMLQKIDGQAVKGGRLGRYFSRTLGAMAGSTGGPFGTLTGAYAGDFVSEVMQNNSIATPIKRMILQQITPDNALYSQAQQALTQLKYGQPLLTAGKSSSKGIGIGGKPYISNSSSNVPIEMPRRIQPLENTDNMVRSKVIRPKGESTSQPVTQIFGENKPKTLPNRVVQVVSSKGGQPGQYYLIPKSEADQIIKSIDGSRFGVAGKRMNGKNWHITAKTPRQMEERGFRLAGIINPKDIPN